MMDRKIFFLNFDLGSLSYNYGRVLGMHPGFGGVKTTGSSVTVDAVVSGQGPFAAVLVGDYIWFYLSDTSILKRRVATKPSNDQITVDSAVNLGAGIASWYFLPFRIGTTDEDGWHSIESHRRAFVELELQTFNGTGGVDVTIEVRGRAPASKPITVFATTNFAAFPTRKTIEILELIGSVRVGLKAGTGFAGTDDLSVFLTGRPAWVNS